MTIDLSEFHDVFFEECQEGLEVMESGLLQLDNGLDGEIDTEELNAIFRAAHSIKGGAAAFGFEEISDLTHVMETLLDEMRDGRRPLTRPSIELLLQSVDCLQQLLDAARNGNEPDRQRMGRIKTGLADMLAADGLADETATEIEKASVVKEEGQLQSPAGNASDAQDCKAESVLESPSAPQPASGDDARAPHEPATSKRAGTGNSNESGSIRVAIDKVDELINLVGELVISQSMLSQIGANLEVTDYSDHENLRDGIAQLERNTRELQESVLQIRMLPISFSFNRFPRLVRDLAGKLNKRIDLKIHGENTEVDKTVLEKIGDPLVHLVRNSLDHGLETPEIRKAAGKPETGTLKLEARHEGGNIIIEVIDDGAGIDREVICRKAMEKGLLSGAEELTDEQAFNLIFEPGFSTADAVSDVSGRGVGLDVVRRNIRDLGGNICINSVPGKGSKVTIHLPLTLAILDGQLVRIGMETYIIPLASVIESLQIMPQHVGRVTGQTEVYRLRDRYIPIIRLNELFGLQTGITDLGDGLMVVVESGGEKYGLFIDDVMAQQQVVIKSLETNFQQVRGIAGATILGDGTVALIMDINGLIERHHDQTGNRPCGAVALAQ